MIHKYLLASTKSSKLDPPQSTSILPNSRVDLVVDFVATRNLKVGLGWVGLGSSDC
jgi:hypothetical protein